MKFLLTLMFLGFCIFGCSTASYREGYGALKSGKELSAPKQSILNRRYQDGEVIKYHIYHSYFENGVLKEIQEGNALSKTVAEPAGGFHESVTWKRLTSNGKEVKADPNYKQILTLDPKSKLKMAIPPPTMMNRLVFDTLNFFANEFVAISKANLIQPGDHALLNGKGVNSWKNPQTGIILGADCLDYDVMLLALNGRHATVRVVNIPPLSACEIALPEGNWSWLKNQLGEPENNLFQIQKQADGKFMAFSGIEIVDTIMQIDIESGKILSASMHNPVVRQVAICYDEKGNGCEKPKQESLSGETFLNIEL